MADGVPLLPRLGGGRHARPGARRAARAGTGQARGAQPRALGGDRRLPVGQGLRHRLQGNARVRRGQEDQRPQAPHHHRHARAAAGRDGHRRLDPGSRRRPRDPQTAQGRAPRRAPHLRRRRLPGTADRSPSAPSRSSSRSSRSPPSRSASRCCPAAGWSSAPSPGFCAGDGWCATTNAYPRPTKRSSSGPWSGSCSTASRHHPDPGPGPPTRGENKFRNTFSESLLADGPSRKRPIFRQCPTISRASARNHAVFGHRGRNCTPPSSTSLTRPWISRPFLSTRTMSPARIWASLMSGSLPDAPDGSGAILHAPEPTPSQRTILTFAGLLAPVP